MKMHINQSIIYYYILSCLMIAIITDQSIAQFQEQSNITLTGIHSGKAVWGDYNNDGYLDLLLCGSSWSESTESKVYKNNGDETFTEQSDFHLINIFWGGSAAWFDFNNDGFLDILLTGMSYSDDTTYTITSKLYLNNKNETFSTQPSSSFPGLILGSISLGDYNNDGYTDLIMTGSESDRTLDHIMTKVFKNNGIDSFVEQPGIHLPGITEGAVAWGDYNNDSYLDILMAGRLQSGQVVTNLFKNNGDESFTEDTSVSIIGVCGGSVTWGDYNNDGFLDILITGFQGQYGSPLISLIYKNNGDGTFEPANISLTAVGRRSQAIWGDYNNDGFLDILLVGSVEVDTSITDTLTGNIYGGIKSISKIYKNNGDETFTEQKDIILPGVQESSVAWCDYDNDGKLDFILTGITFTKVISTIFKNIGNYTPNTPPGPPSELQSFAQTEKQLLYKSNNSIQTFSRQNYSVKLKWSKASDAQTQGNGLSYNLRIGTSSGGIDVICPMSSLVSGQRKIPSPGNTEYIPNGYKVDGLNAGVYYWSIQAIDHSFTGGAWSPECKFTVGEKIDATIKNTTIRKSVFCFSRNTMQIFKTTTNEPYTANIFDLNGKSLLKKNCRGTIKLNLSGLRRGSYILNVKTTSLAHSYKFIKVDL